MWGDIFDALLSKTEISSNSNSDDQLLYNKNIIRYAIKDIIRFHESKYKVFSNKSEIISQFHKDLMISIISNFQLAINFKELHLNRCYEFNKVTENRFHSQSKQALQRIKDLIFELRGEYEKSITRVRRRQEYLDYRNKLLKIEIITKLKWERFCYRMVFEIFRINKKILLNNINQLIHVLSYDEDGNEISTVLDALNQLDPNPRYDEHLLRIVKFSMEKNSINNECLQETYYANTKEDFKKLMNALILWMSQYKGNRNDSQMKFMPSECKYEFLRFSSIHWMDPISYSYHSWNLIASWLCHRKNINNDLDIFMTRYECQYRSKKINDRLYYCIEERYISILAYFTNIPGDNEYLLLHRLISQHYCKDIPLSIDSLEDIRRLLSQMLIFESYVDSHKMIKPTSRFDSISEIKHLLNSFPDIIKMKTINGSFLHFAPATSLQLAELEIFNQLPLSSDDIRSASKSCPHPWMSSLVNYKGSSPCILKNLFICVSLPYKELSLEKPFMIPLHKSCILELLKYYIWPNLNFSEEDLDSVSRMSSRQSVRTVDTHIETDFDNIFSKPLENILRNLNSTELLPEHARYRYSEVSDISSTYILMPADIITFESPKKSKTPQEKNIYTNTFYLIQVDLNSNQVKKSLELRDNRDDLLLRTLLKTSMKLLSNDLNRNSNKQSLISSQCQWRACCMESMSSVGLCKYHDDLKNFMDNNSEGLYDSRNYLLKKIKIDHSLRNTPQVELEIIRSMSVLIREFWDGKLKLTMNQFIKKVCKRLSIRNRLKMTIDNFKIFLNVLCEAVSGNSMQLNIGLRVVVMKLIQIIDLPRVPTWFQWSNRKVLENRNELLDDYESTLTSILELEQQSSQVFEKFVHLKYYPNLEIGVIKKDLKLLKDSIYSKSPSPSKRDTGSARLNKLASPRNTSNSPGSISPSKSVVSEDSVFIEKDNMVKEYDYLSHEKFITEKKVAILSSRFQEECQLRAAEIKKLARKKAIEDIQASDPRNFRNQSRF